MRWGPFQTGEIKESEPSDIDNYEISIFYEVYFLFQQLFSGILDLGCT